MSGFDVKGIFFYDKKMNVNKLTIGQAESK